MVNMDIGSLALFNIYVQDDKHLTGAQAGLITIPYMLCSLLMIRVGERFMQKSRATIATYVRSFINYSGYYTFSLHFVA